MISDAGVLIISSATNEDSLLPTSPRRDKMDGSGNVGNVKFPIFCIPGVKKVNIGFAAKYAIWKHLDSSSFKIIAKVAS